VVSDFSPPSSDVSAGAEMYVFKVRVGDTDYTSEVFTGAVYDFHPVGD
jgi:hypothetical protein